MREDARGGDGLVLVGYRTTGKTTVGRILAGRLGRPFVDADEELERRIGRSIRTLFATEGEAAFRDLEEQTVEAICRDRPGSVLATGGGVVLRAANRERLARYGTIVWLSAPADVLVERLRRDEHTRPALTTAGLLDEVAVVLEGREPLYRDVADLIVDASVPDPQVVAMRILDSLSVAERGRE